MDNSLYEKLCSYDNLLMAFNNAKKGKSTKQYVIEFRRNLKENLLQLQHELASNAYKPIPLQTFIIHDPKTRKISKSAFRDRVVHHALYNVISNIFEKGFIFDSYANRVGKGTFKAIQRFEHFNRKSSHNFTRKAFVLKADITKYFDNVLHNTLISILRKKIQDEKVIWLITVILANYNSKEDGKGMPLGNLTSQFFANVYLNELDQFVKHQLRAGHYIRYVDDFVIFHYSRSQLEVYKIIIGIFLRRILALSLHPEKSKIIHVDRGVEFLGMKIFPCHKSIKKKNLKKFRRKFALLCEDYGKNLAAYDKIYDFLEGWIAYSRHANTYKLRNMVLAEIMQKFPNEVSAKEINRQIRDLPKNP